MPCLFLCDETSSSSILFHPPFHHSLQVEIISSGERDVVDLPVLDLLLGDDDVQAGRLFPHQLEDCGVLCRGAGVGQGVARTVDLDGVKRV